MVASASVFSHNASEFMHSALGANFTTFSNMVPQCLFSFLGCFPICTFVQLFWWRLDLVMSLAQCNHFLTPQAVSGIAPLTISLRVALTIPLPVIVLCINKREPRMGPAGCVPLDSSFRKSKSLSLSCGFLPFSRLTRGNIEAEVILFLHRISNQICQTS